MSSLIMPTDESASQYTLFGNDDKEAVVSFIKDFIEPTGKINNGYINTRYACREKFKGKKRFKDDEHADSFYESISAKLVNTGKYVRELNTRREKGYNILLNPTYQNNKSVKINSRVSVFIAGVAALISILTFIRSCNSDGVQQCNQQSKTALLKSQEPEKQTHNNVPQKTDSLGQKKK